MKIRQNTNRLLSLVLSMIMIVQLLPVSALASSEELSGTCGEHLTWRIEGETLYIDGEGAMEDYGNFYDDEGNLIEAKAAPWLYAAFSHVEMDDHVTHIGSEAFIENPAESIKLPSELKSIGNYAFSYSQHLKEVSLPEGLETIGTSVFSDCVALETVTIPSTLKVIPYMAFYGCTHLENVTIAEGVEEIGEGAFEGCCAIYEDTYDSYAEIPGLGRIEIPDSVKKIGMGAFRRNAMLTELVLHEGLEEIGESAFEGCNYLREVTIPSSVQTVGIRAFMAFPLDMPYLPFQWENPPGVMNLYVLSKDLSLYSTDLWGQTTEPWMMYYTTIHAYADSVIAAEIEAYISEVPEMDAGLRIPFYALTPGEHDFSDWAKVDEERHSRICADCDAEEVCPHTLIIDMENCVTQGCETDGTYRWICSACDYAEDYIRLDATGHDPGYSNPVDDEYHETYCYNCGEMIRFPHEWIYEVDPEATEPYVASAACDVCYYETTITVVPEGATSVLVRAEDENGNAVTLPEDAFTVVWKDSAGNTLGEGTSYTHAQDWEISEDNPIIAVLIFSDEIRQAYSVTETVEHTVTQLGEVAEYRLVARDMLTVTGTVSPALGGMTVELTTVLAGRKSTQELVLDDTGAFAAEIRRTAASLTVSAQGYKTVRLENIQMMPAVDGVIDLGTIEVGDKFATEYVSVEYTDDYSKAIAQELVRRGAQVTLTGADGTEYHGAAVRKYPGQTDEGGYKFRILLGADVSDDFELGEQVTLSYLDKNDCAILPYTFRIARDGEQQPLELELEKALELGISLSQFANLYVFDEQGAIVHSGRGAGETLTLPKGTYTVVAYACNDHVSGIDSPDTLERAGVSADAYVKETITLTADTAKHYTVPDFTIESEISFSVSFGTNLRIGDMIPVYITYSDKSGSGFAENVGLQIELMQLSQSDKFPFAQQGGRYAFGAAELALEEKTDFNYDYSDGAEQLTITTHKSEGVITLYARSNGGFVRLKGTGLKGYTTVHIPGNQIDFVVPEVVYEPEGELHLYAKLASGRDLIVQLFVDGVLQDEMLLYPVGVGEHVLRYELPEYDDGVSTHMVQAVIVDRETDEVFWSSPVHMMLRTDEEDYPVPLKLGIRNEYVGTRIGWDVEFDLSRSDSMSVEILTADLNDDRTVNRDMVFDYRLTMSDPSLVENSVVTMKIFTRETDPVPTIIQLPMKLNPETQTFDATFVLEANTYTDKDMPYGYSFVYAAQTAQKFSEQQMIDKIEQRTEALQENASANPYDYHDPEEVEFMLQNATELSEADREMIRTLLSIENDLYNLRTECDSDAQALAAELYGDGAASDDPMEVIAAIMDSTSGNFTCESAGGLTAEALLDMGYRSITAAGQTFYLYQDESGYLSLVDPTNDLHYAFGTPPAVYSRTRAADEGEGNDNFASYARVWIFAAISATQGIIDTALSVMDRLRGYYNDLMSRKLGFENEIDQLNGYVKSTRDRISDLANNANLSSGTADSLKAAQKSLDDLEEVVALNEKLDRLMSELKSLRADLSTAAGELDNLDSVMPRLRAKVAILNKLDIGAFKKVGISVGVDIVSAVLLTIDAFEAYQVGERRHESITTGEKLAKKAKEKMEKALQEECLKDPAGAQAQFGKCLEEYNNFKSSAEDAKSWNKRWFATKVEQVIGQIASSAAGALIKGTAGLAASVGIGLAGSAAEYLCLEMYNHHYGWMVSYMEGVNFECVRPLPFEKKENCDEEEEEEEEESETSGQPEQPKYPISTPAVPGLLIDPAGYAYEAVASNRIEGATAKAYYEDENGEAVYWDDAHLYGEVNPQITDIEGRFAWMTPIGNWLVRITKDGYANADSKNDPAAENGWLPVPPPQLDVNIGLISTAAPEVESAAVAADQAQVVFSQYMEVSQFAAGDLITVTQNGVNIPVTAVFTDAEVSPTDDAVYYGRVLKLTRTDGQPFSGSGIEIGIDAEVQNYAGKAMESAYASGALTAAQIAGSLNHSYPNRYVTDISQSEEIVVQVLDTAGQPMAGVAVTAKQKLGGTMEITETAVSDGAGRARFTVRGISSGYDTVIFESGILSAEMNTRVSPMGTTAPRKPTANLSDHAVVASGTQLVLSCATEGAVIYYTTDDTCPCTDGEGRKVYEGPITITEDTYFRIAAWTQVGGYSERLNLHLSVAGECSMEAVVDGMICNVALTNAPAGSVLYCASYAEGGKMLSVEQWDVTTDSHSFTIHEDAGYVRVYLVDGTTYKPVTAAKYEPVTR